MISTRENPTVILHHHTYIPECAWIEDKEHQAMWNEMLSLGARCKAQAEVVNATAELAKAANVHTAKFGLYANELYNRIEGLEKRADSAQKQIKQLKGCGW